MKNLMKPLRLSIVAGIIAFSATNIANALPFWSIESFEKAQITAEQAIALVQTKLPEAQIKGIRFHHTKYGKDYYQVKISAEGTMLDVDIDANEGEILGSEERNPPKIKVYAHDEKTNVTFFQAISTALSKVNGKVTEADLHMRSENPFYTVEILVNKKQFIVAIDANNDKIIDLPEKFKAHPPRGPMLHDKDGNFHPDDEPFAKNIRKSRPHFTC